jgi:hypothetical protein
VRFFIKNKTVNINVKLVENIKYLLQKYGVVPRAGFERAQNGDDTKEFPFFGLF